MKRLLITLVTIIAAITVKAQTVETRYDSLENKFITEYNDEKYSEASETGEQLAILADSLGSNRSDTLYITIQSMLGKSYFRAKKPLEAAHAVDKAIERMRKTGSTNEVGYANILDNAGLYYNSAEMCDSGLVRSKMALDVMSNFPDKAVSQDMYIILLHLAEASYYTNKYQDAIVYEIRALNIIEKMHGKHSEEYLGELPYLAQYYRGAKEDKKAEDIDAEVDQIQEEYDKGQRDIPDPNQRDLTSADECHKYNYEALRCAEFYLTHRLGSNYMQQCTQYLIRWSAASSDIHITMGPNEAKLLGEEKSVPYFVAYIAGCTKYALENNDSTFSEKMFNDAMIDMLNFYIGNRDRTGKVKYLEKYVDAFNKGMDNLTDMLNKNYPEKK